MDNKLQDDKLQAVIRQESLIEKNGVTNFVKQQISSQNAARLEKEQQEQIRAIQLDKQRELDYQNAVLNALQGIEKNTAFLTEITLLLQKNNAKQDETFNLLVEILEIMKSSNQEEALSKFRAVMQKISNFTGDVGTMQTLYGIGNTVINAYQSLPF